MRKSLITIVGLAIALSFMSAYADITPATSTQSSVQPIVMTKSFTGMITKIDAKLSTISVKGDVPDKTLDMTTVVVAFSVNNQTLIKINRVKKVFKDLALNMVVLVTYQVRNNVNVAITITNPPPLPGQTP